MSTDSTQPRARRPRLLTAALALLALAAAILAGALLRSDDAPAQTLEEKLNATQSKILEAEEKEEVLTSEISEKSAALSDLEGQVAALRAREAAVAEKLQRKQRELEAAQRRLEVLRARLARAIEVLSDRLVDIYKSGEPDVVTVILESDGFSDLLERSEYLQRIEDQDSALVARVRELRNQTRELVETVKAARDAIAKHKQELESVRVELEAQTAALAAARAAQQATLSDVQDQRKELEGDLSAISKQIEEQLGSSPTAGPIRRGSGAMIWPVDGFVSSPFGWRWGRMHEGIDIAVGAGTPIRAAMGGNIILAGYTGGYGNYTCIDHGGGLSTCYAHQSSYARTSGSVSQGTVIGYVGCTGSCYGDHVHFEVRVNGAAVDPLGYL